MSGGRWKYGPRGRWNDREGQPAWKMGAALTGKAEEAESGEVRSG